MLSHVKAGRHAGTSVDHNYALSELSCHDVLVWDPFENPKRHPSLDNFDAIIVHYSIVIWNKSYLSDFYINSIRSFKGLKILFIQDEYRNVYQAIDKMVELGIDVLYTCFQPYNIDNVYNELRKRGVRIVSTLTGYVPLNDVDHHVVPMKERPLDVVYRARPLSPALGRLGQEKIFIGAEFLRRAQNTNLRHDIDWLEERRIYGENWLTFLASSRASLGVESGASIVDFTGEIDRAVYAYFLELSGSDADPTGAIDGSLYSRLCVSPPVPFEQTFEEILAPFEGNVVLNVISPRAFEAIRLRSALVLFPGEYSNILERGRHYIPLEKDFSNFDEVVEQIMDTDYLERLTERTYSEIIESGLYSYASFVRGVDEVILEEWQNRVQRPNHATPSYFPLRKPEPSQDNIALGREEWRKLVFSGELTVARPDIADVVNDLNAKHYKENAEHYRHIQDLLQKIDNLSASHIAELATQNHEYSKEIARLNDIYSAEIERLHTVYGEQINRLTRMFFVKASLSLRLRLKRVLNIRTKQS